MTPRPRKYFHSVLLPERELKAAPSPALTKLAESTWKSLYQDNRTALFPTFPTTILQQVKKELPHTNPRQEPGGHTRHRWCKRSLPQPVAGHKEEGGVLRQEP